MNNCNTATPGGVQNPGDTPAASVDASTLALIDAVRALDNRIEELHRVAIRTETRLVRLIRHLGAQDDINTKLKGNLS
jgi:ribonuclease PH